jgi:hypothetical protein
MKTYAHLWEKFISIENFVKAYKDARKGKGKQRSVQKFKEGWALKLYALRKSIINGNFHTSSYRSMTIYEPKKRTIYKLPFCPDRIVQHAIVNILAPILERKFIFDTYSCIPGRGQIKASQRCMKAVRRNKYCLKCDIYHFYPSIDQRILSGIYHKIIKDEKFLKIIDDVIFSFPGGKNAPIGNYMSQWSGNLYLTPLDYFVKKKLKVRDYLRYCDDFMLFSDDKKFLHDCRQKIEIFIKKELKLEFSKSDVLSVRQGVDFCGYRHFDNFVLLRKSTKIRERRRIEEIKGLLDDGKIDKGTARACIDSILGWMRHAKTKNLRRSLDVLSLRQFISSI